MDEYFDRRSNGPPFTDGEEMKYEFCRLLSFNNWPESSPVFPLKLAKAGFYYSGNGDEVKCFKCGAVKSDWLAEDEPNIMHRLLNPDCPLLVLDNEHNVPLSRPVSGQEDSSLIKRLNSVLEEKVADNQSRASTSNISEQSEIEEGESDDKEVTAGDEAGSEFSQPQFTLSSEDNINETSMSASRSLGFINDHSNKGLQNTGHVERSATFPNSLARFDANLADSARRFEKDGSRSIAHGISSNGASGSIVKSKETKKKDKSSKKSKDKKDKKSSNNSGNSSSNETPSTTARGQDIPPPMGESLGPLRFERNRLQTFNTWPSNACVPAAELAKCGFYYTGSGDRVQCIFCKGILRNWEEGDLPHIEHRKHFPRCPLVLGLKMGNVPLPLAHNPTTSSQTGSRTNLNSAAANAAVSLTNMENLGIITDRPKHPQYAIESQRLASFQNWPPYRQQTPQQLAEAGFWYAGFNDNVKCFYCDGGLRNWEPGDEPWNEHARWFPKCPYVIQVKGQDFINNVLRENNIEVPTHTHGRAPDTSSQDQEPYTGRYRIEEREIRARMDSPQIKKILDLGIEPSIIMDTLRKRLRETGDDFQSTTALMEAIYKEEAEVAERQREHPPASQDEQASQNAPGVSSSSEEPGTTEEMATTEEPGTSGSRTNLPENQSIDKEQTEKQSDDSVLPQENHIGDEDFDEDLGSSAHVHMQADELMKENLELKEQRLCKICMSVDANVVFLPCGHLVSCASCAPALQLCPICRAAIKGTVRTYIA